MSWQYVRTPSAPLQGEILLPSSKSISNRLLVMQRLSHHKIKISNISEADDTQLLELLLNKSEYHKNKGFTNQLCELNCGNAGTVFRFLTAYLCQQKGIWLLNGSQRMKQRPVSSLCNALLALGAKIGYTEQNGFPPIIIHGNKLRGGYVGVDASQSSQFISALLMIAPLLEGGLNIELLNAVASEPYIDMTLALMLRAGIIAHRKGNLIAVEKGEYHESSFAVEPDWSSASYWYEAVALLPESGILLKGLSLNSLQGDVVLTEIFGLLGVGSYETAFGISIRRISEPQANFSFDFRNCPDLVPAVAATCAALNVEATLTGLQNLKIKESNRLEVLCAELRKVNSGIEISGENILHIRKQHEQLNPDNLHFHTYNDHRMAMALAPLAARYNQIYIADPEVVSKSYPMFWNDLQTTGFRLSGSQE